MRTVLVRGLHARALALFGVVAVVGCGGHETAIVADLAGASSDLSATLADGASTHDLAPTSADLLPFSPTPTFSGGMKYIIGNWGCFSCHMTSQWDNVEGLTLAAESSQIITALTTTKSLECPTLPYITPGSPDDSYLYQKVTGAGSCFVDDQMPDQNPPIDADAMAALKGWITAGALND